MDDGLPRNRRAADDKLSGDIDHVTFWQRIPALDLEALDQFTKHGTGQHVI